MCVSYRVVESKAAPFNKYTAMTNSAYEKGRKQRARVVKEVCSSYVRVSQPTIARADQSTRTLLRKGLGDSTALPSNVIRGPTRSRHKIGRGYFHPSEKVHVSEISPIESMTREGQISGVQRLLREFITSLGIPAWQFEVEVFMFVCVIFIACMRLLVLRKKMLLMSRSELRKRSSWPRSVYLGPNTLAKWSGSAPCASRSGDSLLGKTL